MITKFTKKFLADCIVDHHLFEPNLVRSKRYYRYDRDAEVNYLLRTHSKQELYDIFDCVYDTVTLRELTASEIGW